MSSDRNPKQNFQEMLKQPPKVFFAYFWDYYKWHVLIALAVIIAVVSTIVSIASQKDTGFSVMFFDTFSLHTTPTMEEEFLEYAGMDSRHEAVQIQSDLFMEDNLTNTSITASQLFYTRTAAGEVDAITLKSSQFAQVERDLFEDLRLHLTPEQLDVLSGSLYYIDAAGTGSGSFDPEGMTDPVPVGIDLTASAVFARHYAFVEGDCILGICCNGSNRARSGEFLAYLFPD